MNRITKLLITAFLFVGAAFSLSAQQRTIKGTVLDETSVGVPGAAVILEGTSNGVMTGDDGSFSISVPASGTASLTVSILGYATQTVQVSSTQDNIKVVLKEDNLVLNETVVVGYGVQKKVNLTGAISTVDTESLENRPAHSLATMLQGSVPGLNITTSAGAPGSAPEINIRGYTSINGAEPIVLIDGAIGDLDRVNADDVASISVIKDAAAAAVYGARAAFGVILVTTKSGSDSDGKATVRYSGRWGWESNTTSTDYETTGYWSVYVNNLFWSAYSPGNKYVRYNDEDMRQLLLRVNDKTENPERPWVTIQNRDGRDQYVYYGNFDWYHYLYSDTHPVQQHSVSLSGGVKGVKYYVSGAYDRQQGVMKINPDIYQKYNLRAKVDFPINKWMKFSNNTTYYGTNYTYSGITDPEDTFASGSRHALACFTPQNPDGTWVYKTSWTNYQVNNGRHIVMSENNNVNIRRRSDFTNTAELTIKPIKGLEIKANYTYRTYQSRNTYRRTGFSYSQYPDEVIEFSDASNYADKMSEVVNTVNYHSANVYATYDNTFAEAHHLTATLGYNFEARSSKDVTASGQNLITRNLSDLDLVGEDESGNVITSVAGGQSSYALQGIFGRVNYNYKERYLFEISGRYDGTSRFAKGHRWGFFPSGSIGWRISEEPFFAPAKRIVSNLKLRASYGQLGNQNVSNYAYLQTVGIKSLSYSFKESTALPKYSYLSSPNATDLTWEVAKQANIGLDVTFLGGKLDYTLEGFIRNTTGMLTDGVALPAAYGADSPQSNAADLSTRGFEMQGTWKDGFKLAGDTFHYHIGANMSYSGTYITKYDNKERSFAKDYYVGQEIGEIWGYVVDGLFASDEEAAEYTSKVDQSFCSTYLTGGWKAGDLRYVDLDGDGKISVGSNTVDNPGDRKIIGNSRAKLRYGFNFGFDWYGVDVSATFEGTGNRYWYPGYENMAFWGPYCRPYVSYLPKNFMDNVWSEDNPDAYFPRPRGYVAGVGSGRELTMTNTRYLQNIKYLRFKNLAVGYTLPKKWTRKIHIDKLRVYYSGENICYWSPLKKVTKYIDPEAAYPSNSSGSNGFYPWQKTHMFGVEITF